mgnify:CR=1 FL=1
MKVMKKGLVLLLTMAFILSVCGFVCAEDLKPVNINTATKEELTTLDRVGPAIADRIIEYREKNGFEKPEDIMNVKGVGEAVFERNKGRIIVEKKKEG